MRRRKKGCNRLGNRQIPHSKGCNRLERGKFRESNYSGNENVA